MTTDAGKTEPVSEAVKPAEVTQKVTIEETQPADAQPQSVELKPTEAPAPKESDKVQINMLVTRRTKEMAEREAELAFSYGWIESPSLTQLFNWTVEFYLREGIRQQIETRRQADKRGG